MRHRLPTSPGGGGWNGRTWPTNPPFFLSYVVSIVIGLWVSMAKAGKEGRHAGFVPAARAAYTMFAVGHRDSTAPARPLTLTAHRCCPSMPAGGWRAPPSRTTRRDGRASGRNGRPPAAPAHHPPVAGPPKKQQQGRPRRSQRKPRVPPPLPFARANRRLQQARYSQGRPPPLGKEKRGQSVVGGKRAGARAAAAGGREPTVGQRVRRGSAT